MPQVASAKPAVRAKRVPAGLVVVGAVAVGAAIGWAAWYFLVGASAATVAKQAQTLDDQGRYQDALTKLEGAQHRAIKTSDKQLILVGLAGTYQDMNDNANALKYYQQLNKLQPVQLVNLISMGELAERMGNKPVALEAYKQALAARQVHPTGLYAQSEIDTLNARITELSQ